jgi:predicted transcriptional regulator
MTHTPETIQASAGLGEAARLMRDRDVGLLPVMSGEELVGVITDRDLVVRGIARDGNCNVGSIATPNVCTVTPGTEAAEAVRLMSEADVRRVPVQENGRLVGIVSVGDLAVRADPALAGKVMQQTGPDRKPTERHWPGAGLTRNSLSNGDTVVREGLGSDVQRDISQQGTAPTPEDNHERLNP